MNHSGREKTLWSIGLLVVLLFSLIPVLWIISLSLKTPATITDQSFFPTEISRAGSPAARSSSR
jgi:multiple sugar transport system permease protein